MIQKTLLFILHFIVVTQVVANAVIDSLENVLLNKQGIERAEVLNELSWEYAEDNSEKAL